MARTSIQEFRAALTDRANQSALMRGYREISRRITPPDATVGGEWIPWGAESRSPGEWAYWTAAPAARGRSGGATRLAGWGDWTTQPATAA